MFNGCHTEIISFPLAIFILPIYDRITFYEDRNEMAGGEIVNREIIGQFIRWAMGRDATVFFLDDGLGKIHISIPYVTAGGNVISIEPGPFALGRGMGKTMRKVVQSLGQWTASFNSNDYMVKKLRETGTAMDVRELLEDMDRAMEDLEQSVWKMNHLMEALVHGLDLIYGGQGRHPESDGLIHVVSHKRAHQFLEAWLWWEEYRIMGCPVGQAPLATRLLFRNKEDRTWGAMDNRQGECWVESFSSPWDALDYLFDKSPDEIRGLCEKD